MKILITLCLISSMAFATAATCDVHNSSSSVDQLVTLANNNLSVAREISGETDEDFLAPQFIKYLCTTIDMANRSSKDPYEAFIKSLTTMVKVNKIQVDNITKFAFENLDKLTCENKDTIKMRTNSTLLKYALDSRNYDFIRGALFIKKDGKNVCNPYIDFAHKESIKGEDETIMEFIDKILNEDGMGAFHDFDTIKNIKLKIKGCVEVQKNNNA